MINISKMRNAGKLPTYVIPIFGALTVISVNLFLSGKIVSIPKGTNQGGIMGAIGVSVIIVTMAIMMIASLMLMNRMNKRTE